MDLNQHPTQNQYDFILNPEKPHRAPLLGGGGMKNRLLLVAGVALVLIIAASVIAGLLSSAGGGPVSQLKSVTAQQQEIIRIAETGAREAQSADTRAFALTALLSTRTDQQKLQALLNESGVKLTPQELAAKKSSATDEKLSAAETNNRYDEALSEVLTGYLTDYRRLLQTAYDSGAGPNTKSILEQAYDSASALLGTE